MASQRHKLTVQNVTAAGEIIAQGQMAPGYIIQLAEEAPAGREADGAVEVPMGPSGGPLAGSSLAGPIPESIVPPEPPEPPDHVPVLTSIDPTTAQQGPAVTLHAYGSNFADGAKIFVFNTGQDTTFVSSTELTCELNPSQLLPGTYQVQVRNLTFESAELPITITDDVGGK